MGERLKRAKSLGGAAVAVFLLTSALAGCYRHDFAVSGTTPEPYAAQSEWQHHLINGLINLNDDVDLRSVCPQGVSRIENGMSVLNAILYLLTLTLYSPTTVEVYCRETPAPTVPSEEPAAPAPVLEQPSTEASMPEDDAHDLGSASEPEIPAD